MQLRWEIPSPSAIQKIYKSSVEEATDPRFVKLHPVFRCSSVKCGNRQRYELFFALDECTKFELSILEFFVPSQFLPLGTFLFGYRCVTESVSCYISR